jgi:DNA-directed RNA polymerase specialized sigma24 family protein
MANKKKQPTIEDIINRAVQAQRVASDRQAKDTFKATERRLYGYTVIKLKIEDNRERITEIEEYGAPGKSKSIVRFQRFGVRLTPEEIAEALVNDTRVQIAADEYEIETIDKALGVIAGDQYADIVKYKYFDGKTDDEIAQLIPCDPSTVRRNKSRLVGRLSVFLYGVAAIH